MSNKKNQNNKQNQKISYKKVVNWIGIIANIFTILGNIPYFYDFLSNNTSNNSSGGIQIYNNTSGISAMYGSSIMLNNVIKNSVPIYIEFMNIILLIVLLILLFSNLKKMK